MRVAIVGDVHNRRDKLHKCLRNIGAIEDESGFAKRESWHLIQLGDLLSLGYGEQEANFYRDTRGLFDVELIGNHELPAIHPEPRTIAFMGWDGRDHEAAQMVHKTFLEGELKVAAAVGHWLVTHAGIHPEYFSEWWTGDVESTAAALNDRFVEHVTNRGWPMVDMYDAISRDRGGWDKYGSVFWGDFSDLEGAYNAVDSDAPPQIVGHTGNGGPKHYADGLLWNIDTPRVGGKTRDFGGVAALVMDIYGNVEHLEYVP